MTGVRRACRVLLVLWAGSLWSLALWVAPTLFAAAGDRHLDVGLAVMALLSAFPDRARLVWGYAAAAILAVNEWLLARPMSIAHAQGHALGLSFGAWHGVAAALYVCACLAVLVLVWKQDLR